MDYFSDLKNSVKLARIDLSENEKERLFAQLPSVFEYFKQMDEIPDSDDFSVFSPVAVKSDLRPDVVRESLAREEALKNAPVTSGNLILAPKVIHK